MIERKDFIRFTIFGSAVVGFLLLLLSKYFSLMVVHHSAEPTLSRTAVVERGPILDRNGRVLAVETRQDSVTAWLPNVVDRQAVADALSGILDLTAEDIRSRMDSTKGFVYIERKISHAQSMQIQSLIDSGRLRGISLEPELARIYPQGELAGHAIGFVGTDNTGLAGIEYSMNSRLTPVDLRSSSTGNLFGDQVFLTIDVNIQYFAEQVARRVHRGTGAETVMLLIAEAKTGDILGYVSVPEFDPNHYTRYTEADRSNRPMSYIYEPGSVMKIFTISSFLQLGGITPQTRFYDDGEYVKQLPNGSSITITGVAPHEWETPQLIIKRSSNVGAAYSSDTVSDQAFYEMLRNFGFGQPTYLSLPGETSGILRPTDQWTPRSKPTIAFGQEIGVSAVQIVAAATALANEGVLLKPHIVHKIVAPDGTVIQRFSREPIRRVLSPAVAREMLAFMESGTEPDGVASLAKIPGIATSAKTGTSNIYDPKTGGYSNTAYVASTISVFPTDNPQYIVYGVVIDPKKGPFWGATVAAPMVREVSERLSTYVGLPTSHDRVVQHPATIVVPPPIRLVVGDRLPDLIGLSKRDLLPLLANPAINLQASGAGWVYRQEPAPGTAIMPGMTVEVELR